MANDPDVQLTAMFSPKTPDRFRAMQFADFVRVVMERSGLTTTDPIFDRYEQRLLKRARDGTPKGKRSMLNALHVLRPYLRMRPPRAEGKGPREFRLPERVDALFRRRRLGWSLLPSGHRVPAWSFQYNELLRMINATRLIEPTAGEPWLPTLKDVFDLLDANDGDKKCRKPYTSPQQRMS